MEKSAAPKFEVAEVRITVNGTKVALEHFDSHQGEYFELAPLEDEVAEALLMVVAFVKKQRVERVESAPPRPVEEGQG